MRFYFSTLFWSMCVGKHLFRAYNTLSPCCVLQENSNNKKEQMCWAQNPFLDFIVEIETQVERACNMWACTLATRLRGKFQLYSNTEEQQPHKKNLCQDVGIFINARKYIRNPTMLESISSSSVTEILQPTEKRKIPREKLLKDECRIMKGKRLCHFSSVQPREGSFGCTLNI